MFSLWGYKFSHRAIGLVVPGGSFPLCLCYFGRSLEHTLCNARTSTGVRSGGPMGVASGQCAGGGWVEFALS